MRPWDLEIDDALSGSSSSSSSTKSSSTKSSSSSSSSSTTGSSVQLMGRNQQSNAAQKPAEPPGKDNGYFVTSHSEKVKFACILLQ
jgi:hypothetical protein